MMFVVIFTKLLKKNYFQDWLDIVELLVVHGIDDANEQWRSRGSPIEAAIELGR